MMPTRSQQKEMRRQRILEAALDQFIRRGYAATKIRDIAAAANMSIGLLFHYYDSKEALYTELIKMGTTAPKKMLGSFGKMEPLAFFEHCAHQVLQVAGDSQFTAKMFVLMGNAYCSEGIPTQARNIALTTNFYRDLAPVILRGQEQGTIREGDPVALCMTFWTALQGVIEAYALDPDLPLPEPEWILDIIRKEKGEPT